METTLDKFLGGRIEAEQPKKGFRAGHDTVLLAAAVQAADGEHVLELGAGVGIASLCLAARVPGVDITGIEIDPELVALANVNAARNGMAERVRFVAGDAASARFDAPFDHVFLNPPFHPASGQPSATPDLDRAKRAFDRAVWVWNALRWAKPEGTITLITRADGLREIEAAASAPTVERRVSLTVLPLVPRAGDKPKRVIVQMHDGDAPMRTLPGFVLHQAGGAVTDVADAVLRGHALIL